MALPVDSVVMPVLDDMVLSKKAGVELGRVRDPIPLESVGFRVDVVLLCLPFAMMAGAEKAVAVALATVMVFGALVALRIRSLPVEVPSLVLVQPVLMGVEVVLVLDGSIPALPVWEAAVDFDVSSPFLLLLAVWTRGLVLARVEAMQRAFVTLMLRGDWTAEVAQYVDRTFP